MFLHLLQTINVGRVLLEVNLAETDALKLRWKSSPRSLPPAGTSYKETFQIRELGELSFLRLLYPSIQPLPVLSLLMCLRLFAIHENHLPEEL
jgi:hypothetical protein